MLRHLKAKTMYANSSGDIDIYSITYVEMSGHYIGHYTLIPEIMSEGKSLKELEENLAEGIDIYFDEALSKELYEINILPDELY